MPLWLEDAAESGWEPPTVAALAALVGLTLPLSSSGHLAGGQLLWPQSGPPWGARIPGVGTGRGKRAERFYFIFWESEGLFYRACFPLWVRRIQKEKKKIHSVSVWWRKPGGWQSFGPASQQLVSVRFLCVINRHLPVPLPHACCKPLLPYKENPL